MSHEHLTEYDSLTLDPQRHAMGTGAFRSVLRTALARLAGEATPALDSPALDSPALDSMQIAMSREGQVRAATAVLRAQAA